MIFLSSSTLLNEAIIFFILALFTGKLNIYKKGNSECSEGAANSNQPASVAVPVIAVVIVRIIIRIVTAFFRVPVILVVIRK